MIIASATAKKLHVYVGGRITDEAMGTGRAIGYNLDYKKLDEVMDGYKLEDIWLSFELETPDHEKLPTESCIYELELLSRAIERNAFLKELQITGWKYGDIIGLLILRFMFPVIEKNDGIQEVSFLLENVELNAETHMNYVFSEFGQSLQRRIPLRRLVLAGIDNEEDLYGFFSAFQDNPGNLPREMSFFDCQFGIHSCDKFSKLLKSDSCGIQELSLTYNPSLTKDTSEGITQDENEKEVQGGGDLDNAAGKNLLMKSICDGLRRNISIRRLALDFSGDIFKLIINNLVVSKKAELAYTSNHHIHDITWNEDSEKLLDYDRCTKPEFRRFTIDDTSNSHAEEESRLGESTIESTNEAGDHDHISNSHAEEASRLDESTIESTDEADGQEQESNINNNDENENIIHPQNMVLIMNNVNHNQENINETNRSSSTGQESHNNAMEEESIETDDTFALRHVFKSEGYERYCLACKGDYEKLEAEAELMIRCFEWNFWPSKTFAACQKVLFNNLQETACGKISDTILVHTVNFFDRALAVGAIQTAKMYETKKLSFYYQLIKESGLRPGKTLKTRTRASRATKTKRKR